MTCQPTAGCTQSDRTSHWPCSIGHAPDALPVARDADKLAPSVQEQPRCASSCCTADGSSATLVPRDTIHYSGVEQASKAETSEVEVVPLSVAATRVTALAVVGTKATLFEHR